ncbi:MAG: hypothetical protein EA392_02950 [Cryomorphaceae bacterium]|nr:MAG: hypothetical protein EA392_02950 [Cryomorphaceae bacterium]
MQVFAEISERLTEDLKQAIIDNRQNATGRTISAIEARHGDNFASVVALPDAHHIWALQYGRGPTQNAGDGTLYDRILEWVNAKGVIFQDAIRQSKYTIQERTAKTITYFIHKRGTYLHHKGETYHGERNPILRVFTQQKIDEIKQEIVNDRVAMVRSEIFKELNKLAT